MTKYPLPQDAVQMNFETHYGVPMDVCDNPTCREVLEIPDGWDPFTRVPCHLCDPNAEETIQRLLKEGS